MPDWTINSINTAGGSIVDEKQRSDQRSQSEDSSFYGNEALRAEYAQHLSDFGNEDYWRVHEWNIQVILARQNKSGLGKKKWQESSIQSDEPTRKKHKQSTKDHADSKSWKTAKRSEELFNPYEGCETALEIGESVDDFLHRLRPSDSSISEPWIWCADFATSYRDSARRLAEFKRTGTELLEQFSQKRKALEASFDPPKYASAITRMLGPDREQLQSDILKAAKNCHITTGKWMLFASHSQIDEYWAAVVRATVDGRLGISAKASTKPSSGDSTHVICVYARNFDDQADLKRILQELVRLNLAVAVPGPLTRGVGNVQKQIYFKTDAYTWLDIMGDNEYKLKASMYSTASLLTKDDLCDSK